MNCTIEFTVWLWFADSKCCPKSTNGDIKYVVEFILANEGNQNADAVISTDAWILTADSLHRRTNVCSWNRQEMKLRCPLIEQNILQKYARLHKYEETEEV